MMHHHDSRDYNVAASEAAKEARGQYERIIENGKAKAIGLLERIHTETPRDRIVPGPALKFSHDDHGLIIDVGDGDQRLHRNARQQLAERTTLGGEFLGKNAESAEPWRRDMAVECLKRATKNIGGRYLSRSVNADVRAMLSPRYRRIDGRPCTEAFVETAINGYGAVPMDGQVSDVRTSIALALPMIFEPVPNEVMLFYASLSFSDYGKGKVKVETGVDRLWCTNKARMRDAFSAVHLGGEIPDDIELSDQTMRLDTERTISLMQDVIGQAFAPKEVNALMSGIKAASEKEIDWRSAKNRLAKTLLKGELDAVGESFEKDESILLPVGRSMWRLSNAVSLLAGKTPDMDRRMELETLAGGVISGRFSLESEGAIA